MDEWTLGTALSLALRMEEQSIRLYTSARERAVDPGSRLFLGELVGEEERHRMSILQAMEDPEKIEEIGSLDDEIPDLKIVDGLVDATLSPEADYQQILIFAAKREKEAHDFYAELAERYRESQIGAMLARLAREELRHKNRLEREYDDIVLKEM